MVFPICDFIYFLEFLDIEGLDSFISECLLFDDEGFVEITL